MVLMASLSCRISPRTSTVIFFDKSPLATAIVDHRRYCALARSDSTPSSSRFQSGPSKRLSPREPAPGRQACRRCRLHAHARHLRREDAELLDHRVDDVRRAQELALQRPAIDIERHVCNRSPRATALTVRVTAVVGHNRSSINALTEPSMSAPRTVRQSESYAGARLALLTKPPRPRAPAVAQCADFAATMVLNASQILPATPIWCPGRRTEKSPASMACSAFSNSG